jgi:PAS domain S-box-containing protein
VNAVAALAASEPKSEDVARLTESFAVFTRAARDLEDAYAALKTRAARIDARLEETNGRLSDKVVELRRAHGRLQATLDAVPCGVVVVNKDGFVDEANAAAERILGLGAAELVGRDAAALRAKDGAPLLLLSGANASDRAPRRLVACDGAVRRVASAWTDLQDGGGIEVLSDLTEVAHLRAQLNRLDTLAALGEMAAGVAHEIRNPLNGVAGFASLLSRALEGADGGDRSKLLRYADRIGRGVAEVEEIVANLLLWARPERLDVSTFSIRDLVLEVVSEKDRLVKGPSLARVDLRGVDDGAPFPGDRVKLKIVLVNLLKNALEATGEKGRVVVEYRRDGTGFAASVEDDGPGISPEMRRKLFRPFSTDKASGTGLGLAIARRLAESHGGELRVEQGTLGGARFAVVLPEAVVKEGAA